VLLCDRVPSHAWRQGWAGLETPRRRFRHGPHVSPTSRRTGRGP